MYVERDELSVSKASAGGVVAVFLGDEDGKRSSDFQEVRDGERGRPREPWASLGCRGDEFAPTSRYGLWGVDGMNR